MMSFFIFGFLGLLASLVYTASMEAIVNRRFDFTGRASLILFPVYGLTAFLYPPIAMHMGNLQWYGRGAILMAAFFAVQYVAGLGLKKINMCPWDYSGRGSIGGLVRIQDAPLWFCLGLIIEWVYPLVKSAARSL